MIKTFAPPRLRLKLVRRVRPTDRGAAEGLLILFFSVPFWEWLAEQLLEPAGWETMAVPVVLATIYFPVAAVLLSAPRRLPADFILLMLWLALYLCATYLFHRDYAYYYTREEYGLWDYVLLPDNGLYAYFFIRLVDDPRRILRGLRVSGYLVYAYSVLRLCVATEKGFWMEEGRFGQEYASTYNMNFGYTLLLFVCCYLYCAFEQGSLRFLLLAGAGIFMILCGGSRGPLLDVAIFVVLHTALRFRRSRHKARFLARLSFFGAGIAAFWRQAVEALLSHLKKWSLHSRTLEMMRNGTVTINNGRDVFWDASLYMIREHPMGYGAMGARHVLCGIHIVGHPHNFFLELIIEYGVVFGPLLILLMCFASLRIFLRKQDNGWQGVFLIFFANACQLMTSYTYWHSPAFWCALAAGVCYFRAERKLR